MGGVLALALSKRLHHGRTIFGGIFVGCLLFAALALVRSNALSALLLSGVGLLGGMVISLVVSGIQARAPVLLRGRVMAMYSITSQVVPAASGVLAGAAVSRWGVVGAIALCGLVLAAIALFATVRMATLRHHAGH